MSRWYANPALRMVWVVVIFGGTLPVQVVAAQDASSNLIPARLGAGQAIWTAAGNPINQRAEATLLFDLYHQNIQQGMTSGGFQTSRMQVSWSQPERKGTSGTSYGLVGMIEDDREADVLQRLRLQCAGFKRIRIGSRAFLTGALQLGYGQRNWRNAGIWDSQYLLNPVHPELESSGEYVYRDRKHYLEMGGELTYQTPEWSIAYRVLHAPVDQGFFRYSADRYAARQSLMAAWRKDMTWKNTAFQSLLWSEIERQSGAMLFTTGVMVERSFGVDSRITGNRSATVVALGMVYRSTGQLAPILSTTLHRRWTVWLAPDWNIGLQRAATGWSAGFRGQLSL